MLSSSGREAAMFTVAGLFPLKPVMALLSLLTFFCVVNSLPHASWVIVVELFFNFVFILSFGCFDGSPEIVTGLFPIVSVSGFKGRCPR